MRPRASVRALAGSVAIVAALAAAIPPAALAANPEGALDTTFDGDGKRTVDNGADTSVADVARQADGKIVIAGSWNNGTTNETFVQRFTTTGVPDTSFSGDGVFRILVGDNDGGAGIGVQADGKIVVVSDTGDSFTVLRLTTGGALDTTFGGGDGMVSTDLGAPDQANPGAFALQPDGKILVAGELQLTTDSDAYIARFTGAGAIDTGFGVGGVRLLDNAKYDYVTTLAIQDDGRIVVGGSSGDDTVGGWFTARLTSTGALDTTWNSTGTNFKAASATYEQTYDSALDPLGRLIIVGWGVGSGFITRFTAGGTLDASFNGTGTLSTGSTAADEVVIPPNGKMVLAGRTNEDWFVDRRFDNGAPDPTFGTNGRTVTSISSSYDSPGGVVLDAAARITVVGTGQDAYSTIVQARYVGDATAPYAGRMLGLPGTFTSRTRTLAWAADDDNTGVARFDVRYRSASYSSSTLGSATTWKSQTTGTYGSFTGSAGRTYCFDVRPYDAAGNRGGYGADSCAAIPVNDRSLSRAGSWSSVSNSGYYLGTASRSTSSGATLKLSSVKYRRLAIVATKCSGCGTVKVYLGSSSTPLATISLNASSTRRRQVITVDVSAALKSGTITIRQSSGGKPVIIEGLAVGLY